MAASQSLTITFERARRDPQAWLELLTTVPDTREDASSTPRARAHVIAQAAGLKAALVAAAMSLPPGPLGWLTLPLELVSVWRIQAQMVADIAGAYGRTTALSQAVMMHCLFQRVTTQVARDLAVRFGQGLLTHRFALRVIESIACRIGASLGRRAVGRGLTRALPVVGAAAAAYCARLDTQQVARAAIAFFEPEA